MKTLFNSQKKSWQKDKNDFTFIDLFAGIGGFRIALEKLGGKCVFSSEWDTNSPKTYMTNSGDSLSVPVIEKLFKQVLKT